MSILFQKTLLNIAITCKVQEIDLLKVEAFLFPFQYTIFLRQESARQSFEDPGFSKEEGVQVHLQCLKVEAYHA